jgi:hypothetical protein
MITICSHIPYSTLMAAESAETFLESDAAAARRKASTPIGLIN